jgi:bifunctional DNA-binding transcriptional regulator/antitoxin component of YhaV-PrlF toxin-antitoxin module
MGEKSIVAKASSKSPSVRTTIPEKIVKEMEIAVGDVLDWETTTQGGRKVVRVKKLE